MMCYIKNLEKNSTNSTKWRGSALNDHSQKETSMERQEVKSCKFTGLYGIQDCGMWRECDKNLPYGYYIYMNKLLPMELKSFIRNSNQTGIDLHSFNSVISMKPDIKKSILPTLLGLTQNVSPNKTVRQRRLFKLGHIKSLYKNLRHFTQHLIEHRPLLGYRHMGI